jgi:hypothetical protein
MKIFLSGALCLVLLCPAGAQARPITYPGGWSVMTMNDASVNNIEAFYTPAPSYSFGWRHDYWRDPEAHMDALQLNLLLKRWNNPGSQANLYLKSGAGVAYEDDDRNGALYGGMAADWENRRWYISYENEFLTAGDIYSKASHKARAGVAPYIGNAGDLHTWLMLQTEYTPTADDEITVTPLVRLFKGTTLLEAGAPLDGGVYFHLMQTF